MNSVARVVALCALCSSVVALATSPVSAQVEPQESLSCVPAAKPFFHRAWDALANVHLDEARELFAQTVAVDPSCILAWAHLGALTPGANGRKLVDDAVIGSSGLTEVERLQVMALAAQHRGDNEQALSLLRSALVYDPSSYMVSFAVAQRAGVLRQWAEMVPPAKHATELAPGRGAAWNLLGYAYVGLQQHPQAVAALRRYAAVAPFEPNAHDSLGDALLANDQLEEAKVAYQRALVSSGGTFWASGHGVATVCALEGDWFCARAAIEKARRTAPSQDDRLKLMEWTAWSYLADDQPGEAYRAIDELEADAARLGLESHVADARLLRGRFLLAQGRYREALEKLIVLGTAKFPGFTDAQRQSFDTRRLHGMLEAMARVGNVSEAERTLAQLRAPMATRPHDAELNDAVAHGKGLIALQRKNPSAAIAEFAKCSETADACRLDLARAQDVAGRRDEAMKTRTAIKGANHRDPEYWWVRVRAVQGLEKQREENRPAF